MSNNQDHQDWTVVTLKKTPKATKKVTNITYTQPKIKTDEDGTETIKSYKLSPQEITDYTRMRNELKLTRSELAKKICCQQVDIDYLETGKPSKSIIGGKYKSFLKKEHAKLNKVT
jgi:DNA-binding transcriptional regulator YiaG